MSNLISILNSGESFEKAAVLVRLALEGNPSFYSGYEKVTVFYCENLPKKDRELEVHGTIGGVIRNLKNKRSLRYGSLEEIWEDRGVVLDHIHNIGRISQRVRDKMMHDKKRFYRVVSNFPWYVISDDFRRFLTEEFINQISIAIEFLDFRSILEIMLKDPKQQYYSRIRAQILNPDGSIGSLTFSKEENKRESDSLKRGIVISPNVFGFILGMYYSQNKKGNLLFGYKGLNSRLVSPIGKFNRNLDEKFLVPSRRPSYDLAIDFLKKQNDVELVMEPKNRLFNNLLDAIDRKHGHVSTERKTNLAIYEYLNKFL